MPAILALKVVSFMQIALTSHVLLAANALSFKPSRPGVGYSLDKPSLVINFSYSLSSTLEEFKSSVIAPALDLYRWNRSLNTDPQQPACHSLEPIYMLSKARYRVIPLSQRKVVARGYFCTQLSSLHLLHSAK
jgi:hypothetical protein